MSMKHVGERHHDSIEKLFGYIGLLAREDIEIIFDEKHTFRYPKAERAVISPTLFRTDSCHSSGRCCKVPFDLAYTQEGIARIDEAVRKDLADAKALRDALRPVRTRINGKDVGVWVHLNDKPARFTGAKTCDFLRQPDTGPFAGKFICGIHFFKPFHCWAPHFVVRKRGKGTGFIGRMQFGRNHQFGCPVVFNQSIAYFDKDYQQDIDKLKWMKDIADDMKVKTWIPQMIHWLENNRIVIEDMLKSTSLKVVEISTMYVDQDEPALFSDGMFI